MPNIAHILALDLLTLLEQPELAGDIFDARTQCDKLEQSLAISEVVAVRRDGALIA